MTLRLPHLTELAAEYVIPGLRRNLILQLIIYETPFRTEQGRNDGFRYNIKRVKVRPLLYFAPDKFVHSCRLPVAGYQ